MTDAQARRMMVRVVLDWLHGNLPTQEFRTRYWATRRALLDSNWNAFLGTFGQIMSAMDTAVDSYSDAPDRADYELSDEQLRDEAEVVVANLRAAGLEVFD